MSPSKTDWAELACQCADQRRFNEAIQCFRHLSANGHAALDPGEDAAHKTIQLLLDLARERPELSSAQFSLGSAYEHLGDLERARFHLHNALRLDSSKRAGVEALNARMFWVEKKWAEALDAADRALAVNPRSYIANLIRGRVCCNLGRLGEGLASLRRALEILPDRNLHSSLLFQMNYLAEITPEDLHAEALRWDALYAAPLEAKIATHSNPPDPDRRLKIGYVSPDLYQHTIMKFVPALLERHDRSRFEVFVYAVGSNSDHISNAIHDMADHYTAVRGPLGTLAGQVRLDGIDILVDLAGHSMGPALLDFALKPAPVQVTWMGYPGTTGMSAMDYFLGDPEMPCPQTEAFFSEKVYRLPRVECCYRPIGQLPIAPAPCLERGYVTFGCFNNPRKITRQAVMLWSAILHLARESRLLMKYHDLDTELGERLREWFSADGIRPERILFEPFCAPGEYLTAYNRIDIALDPFPYNGYSTTLDALWMGVPVITLAGRTAAQRAGPSILVCAGLSSLACTTPQQYLSTALALAATVGKQADLRAGIRQALIDSSWMDEIGLVRDVEDAFRDMWHRWCDSTRQKGAV